MPTTCLRSTVLAITVTLTILEAPSGASPEPREPVSGSPIDRVPGLDLRESAKLRAAHKLASRRVREHPSCVALFDVTGRSGESTLSTMEFSLHGGDICRRGVAATTTVGGSLTRLCGDWLPRLDRYELATLLIHEALHQAGMSEWPHDPDGMRSQEINEMVSSRCEL